MVLTRLPTVLCFHIQRRYYDPIAETMTKTAQHVEFTEYLDANQFYHNDNDNDSNNDKTTTGTATSSSSPNNSQQEVSTTTTTTSSMDTPALVPHRSSPPPLYKLQSVVEHCGNAYSGHYQTYRRRNDNEWCLVSDQSVQLTSWQHVQSCQAYMLFYEAT
uniref:ubiquitinyl hydrolase 1 n=1 Tax=Cyclophora tenuis TaxID=216820 RepID=A0A7S1GLI9_CYCTE|mmetsp:Transcript_18282/g.31155  ORF Transcript_18282/g.31155 Transcript_18282/m.31155 type:complete len:160 (+) Transcript_18282:212-691(+)